MKEIWVALAVLDFMALAVCLVYLMACMEREIQKEKARKKVPALPEGAPKRRRVQREGE